MLRNATSARLCSCAFPFFRSTRSASQRASTCTRCHPRLRTCTLLTRSFTIVYAHARVASCRPGAGSPCERHHRAVCGFHFCLPTTDQHWSCTAATTTAATSVPKAAGTKHGAAAGATPTAANSAATATSAAAGAAATATAASSLPKATSRKATGVPVTTGATASDAIKGTAVASTAAARANQEGGARQVDRQVHVCRR